ncbi:antibiotic biosynthesis monooxygenase [Amycolatopsis sp. FU40]|uniref:antibiotic biosynthesis monooxygenase n=1 Tax=Amycolatopsis sp. FU40 TaxID=2914159 RepID=UPI001F250AD8|nr:antibiotic biosynthesis monooxygenase [Amycolatopsis sp. FU40]UKD53283.1 antibiotic biosynthesis monooxygenase [Amycolatopsis sp. FU40]
MTINRPDFARTDFAAALVAETTVEAAEVLARLEKEPWPAGLISFHVLASTEGEASLVYTQWAENAADPGFVRGVSGGDPMEYRLYRSGNRDNTTVPGCIVVVSVEFDDADAQRQRRWVDTVFGALAGEETLAPGGISGHFHVSADGTRVLNYAEWTDEQSHRDALARSGRGTVGVSDGWQKVQDFPGVRGSGFRRYRMVRSLGLSAKESA